MFLCGYAQMSAGSHESQVLEPVELELQVIVSHVMWMLGTELGFYATAANILLTIELFF